MNPIPRDHPDVWWPKTRREIAERILEKSLPPLTAVPMELPPLTGYTKENWVAKAYDELRNVFAASSINPAMWQSGFFGAYPVPGRKSKSGSEKTFLSHQNGNTVLSAQSDVISHQALRDSFREADGILPSYLADFSEQISEIRPDSVLKINFQDDAEEWDTNCWHVDTDPTVSHDVFGWSKRLQILLPDALTGEARALLEGFVRTRDHKLITTFGRLKGRRVAKNGERRIFTAAPGQTLLMNGYDGKGLPLVHQVKLLTNIPAVPASKAGRLAALQW
jgi:hypothetical protein